MAVTDDELEGLREENDSLRQQIAEADRMRYERDAEASRELEAAQLRAENTRLQAQLDQAQAMADASGAEGSTSLIDAVVAQAEPQVYEPVAPEPTVVEE